MMKNMKRNYILIVLLILIIWIMQGCSPLINDNDTNDDTPLFPGDTSEVQSKDYMLYFQLNGENYLAPEVRTLTIPESKSVEETLIKELISGPKSSSAMISANINQNTRIISVIGKEDVLFVSLSEHFLIPPSGLGQDVEDEIEREELILKTRKMAVYSIANTITELGRYSFVQFYIDYANNGTGTRPTRKEMGFTGEDENQLIEPIYRNTDIIFSPMSSVQTIMSSISERNWARVLSFTSFAEKSEENAEDKIRELELSNLSLLEYNIVNSTVSLNGKSAVVVVSYMFANAEGTENLKENISVKMILEDGIWKCSIVSINQILLGEYE